MDTTPITRDALKKLTVAQLKQLCKDKKISRYSKISKEPLIEKLLHWRNGQKDSVPTTGPCDPPPQRKAGDEEATSSTMPTDQATANRSQEPTTISAILITAGTYRKNAPSTTAPHIFTPTSSREMPPPPIPSRTSLAALQSLSRPESLSPSTPLKRDFTCLESNAHERPPLKKRWTNTSGQSPLEKATNSKKSIPNTRPTLHTSRQELADSEPRPAQELTHRSGQKQPPHSNSLQKSKPFKALLPMSAKGVSPRREISASSISSPDVPSSSTSPRIRHGMLTGIDVDDVSFNQHLVNISLPPSLAQRKRGVPRLAVILSGISLDDLKTCALVSRSFRYAAYLSAKNQLLRRFSGARLDAFLAQHSSPILNLWPYLMHHEREAERRRTIYSSSFVAHVLKGRCRVSDRIWSNPDHPKQSTLLARFLLSTAFFQVSVGIPDGSKAYVETVLDLQEVIPDEVWRVKIHSKAAMSTSELYILEPTCEVVGRPPASADGTSIPKGTQIRADWSSYISGRSQAGKQVEKTIFDHLHWSNHEEYKHGISKLWLKRTQFEQGGESTKVTVAKRYVLASVVANSVSGQWMTYTAMQQAFNGLTSSTASIAQPKVPKLNLFIPAHHHVESVHFETSKKQPLHPAIAVVQTPGREYYILRDNGMQIGCEEDGVAEVWMKLLGCQANGCSVD